MPRPVRPDSPDDPSTLAAAMRRASGRCPQRRASSSTAPDSPAARSLPSSRTSSARESAGSRAESVSLRAPSRATSPGRAARLVTSTWHPGPPGSSGRTWSACRASSSTTSVRVSASRLRKSAAASAASVGTRSGATSSERRSLVSASAGESGGAAAWPIRFRYSWPSGKRCRTRCAQCTASALLPTPGAPASTVIDTAPGSLSASSASISAITSERPVKPATSAGSWAGTGRSAGTGSAAVGWPSTAALRTSATRSVQ